MRDDCALMRVILSPSGFQITGLTTNAVQKAYDRALAMIPVAQVNKQRKESLMRLDDYMKKTREILFDDNASPMERVAAATVLVRIEERRARIQGLDSPRKIHLTEDERTGTIDLQSLRGLLERAEQFQEPTEITETTAVPAEDRNESGEHVNRSGNGKAR